MSHATLLWSVWQDLLGSFAWAFTRRGFRRFAEWITAMALNVEEHTITQSVLALDRPADWKAMESFAEYGAWHADYVTRGLTRLVERAPGRTWHGYRVSAVDDTKVHRGGPHVWGTCTFHEYTARCPNRATTVRAHNWVVLGALLENPGKPAWFLPISGRLYFRKSQLPPRSGMAGPTVEFRTKCELAVELIREQARLRPRAAPGRLRRRLRPPQRRAAAGPPGRRRPADRVPHPAAARCPALRPAADGAAQGQARAEAEVGREAAAAAAGGPLGRAVARGRGLHLRPPAAGPLEGGGLPVAGARARGAGQGGGRLCRGLQEAVHPGHLGGGADGPADGRAVRGAVPPGGRVPRPEAAAGLGGVPGLDHATRSSGPARRSG